MGMARVILALLLIVLVAVIVWQLLNMPKHKEEEAELERVKLEAERLKVEEKIALEKRRNAERRSKIDTITNTVSEEESTYEQDS